MNYLVDIMSIETLKISLVEQLLQVNENEVLEQLQEVLDKNKIVAHTVDGKPLTLSDYNALLEEGEKQIENGEFITQEELEKEVENWK